METKSWFGVQIPVGARIMFFSKTCRPSLEPTLPPLQWVLRVPEVKAPRSWGWPATSILFRGYRWVALYLHLLYMFLRHVQRHFHHVICTFVCLLKTFPLVSVVTIFRQASVADAGQCGAAGKYKCCRSVHALPQRVGAETGVLGNAAVCGGSSHHPTGEPATGES